MIEAKNMTVDSSINPATLRPYADESREADEMADEILRKQINNVTLKPMHPRWIDTPTETGHYAIRYKGFKEPHNAARVMVSPPAGFVSMYWVTESVGLPDPEQYEFYRIEI